MQRSISEAAKRLIVSAQLPGGGLRNPKGGFNAIDFRSYNFARTLVDGNTSLDTRNAR
jgi:hypothetical protein